MTKQEIIGKMAADAGISKTSAGKAFQSILDAVTGAVKKGKKVSIVGFGTFSVSKRKARKGRNPKTGETIKIPASKSPKFTAGKAFKALVNK